MKIEGELYKLQDIKSWENFKKRVFYIKHIDKDKKTQFLTFQATNGKIELLEGYSPGDKLIITFKLEGNEIKNKQGEFVIYDHKEVITIDVPTSPIKKIEQDYRDKKLSF